MGGARQGASLITSQICPCFAWKEDRTNDLAQPTRLYLRQENGAWPADRSTCGPHTVTFVTANSGRR